MSYDYSGRKTLIAKQCACCGREFMARPDRRSLYCGHSCAAKVRNKRAGRGWHLMNTTGYILEKAPAGHPHALKSGHILQYRLVMERMLGGFLHPRERVHHKNGVRHDNRPENLEVWTLDRKDPPGVRVSDIQPRDQMLVAGLLMAA